METIETHTQYMCVLVLGPGRLPVIRGWNVFLSAFSHSCCIKQYERIPPTAEFEGPYFFFLRSNARLRAFQDSVRLPRGEQMERQASKAAIEAARAFVHTALGLEL